MEIFKLFNPEWPITPTKNSRCPNCDILKKKLDEKHQKLVAAINKGNNMEQQLSEYLDKEMDLQLAMEQLQQTNDELVEILKQYDDLVHAQVKDNSMKKQDQVDDEIQTKLNRIEVSYLEIQKRFEKSKEVIEGFKKNEITLLESIRENDRIILELKNKYEALKRESTSKLNEANATLANMQKEFDELVNKYKTKVKLMDITINALENSLEQKTHENYKLATICNEFINDIK